MSAGRLVQEGDAFHLELFAHVQRGHSSLKFVVEAQLTDILVVADYFGICGHCRQYGQRKFVEKRKILEDEVRFRKNHHCDYILLLCKFTHGGFQARSTIMVVLNDQLHFGTVRKIGFSG